MITVSVNNEQKQIKPQCPLNEALQQWNYRCATIAVAINGDFVPRCDYERRLLDAHDCIDIVAPIQGG